MIRSLIRRFRHNPLHSVDVTASFRFIGTEYGGWPLLDVTPQGSLLLSFGVGEDISFDLGAIKEFDCTVHGFDPTPKSIEWIKRQSVPRGFHFHALGLADRDGVVDFYPPENEQHVSFSAEPASSSQQAQPFKGEVRRLATILERLCLAEPYILKMDIEGFEYDVIEDIVNSGIRPRQWLVEFHHGRGDQGRAKTMKAVTKLQSCGYKIFFVSSTGREYGFVAEEALRGRGLG